MQVDEQKQLNTSLVAINHNMEEDLLDQFVTIINTKKQKIIDTENQLEKMMIEHKECT